MVKPSSRRDLTFMLYCGSLGGGNTDRLVWLLFSEFLLATHNNEIGKAKRVPHRDLKQPVEFEALQTWPRLGVLECSNCRDVSIEAYSKCGSRPQRGLTCKVEVIELSWDRNPIVPQRSSRRGLHRAVGPAWMKGIFRRRTQRSRPSTFLYYSSNMDYITGVGGTIWIRSSCVAARKNVPGCVQLGCWLRLEAAACDHHQVLVLSTPIRISIIFSDSTIRKLYIERSVTLS